jgi:hypothetical protein
MESPFFWRTPYSTLNRKELERKTNSLYDACKVVLDDTDTFDAGFRFSDGSPDEIESAKKKICANAHLESLIANIRPPVARPLRKGRG